MVAKKIGKKAVEKKNAEKAEDKKKVEKSAANKKSAEKKVSGKDKKTLKKEDKAKTAKKPKEEPIKKLSAKETTSSEAKSRFYEVVRHPLISEKSVGMIESQNKLCFSINRNFTKKDIKEAIEKMYGIEIDKVRILNDMKGRKKAIVKINNKYRADEIATKLGIL